MQPDSSSNPSEPFSPLLFQAQLRALSRQETPYEGDWLRWLAVIEVALDHPDRFSTGFRALSDEDRFGLLHITISPVMPPFADVVIALLAANLGEENDPQLRYQIGQAYKAALENGVERLQSLLRRLQTSSEFAEARRIALQTGETAALIATQEARLAQLRIEEMLHSQEYGRLLASEMEVLRLETHRAAVAQYPFDEREAYCAQLQAAVQTEGQQRDELESRIHLQANALQEVNAHLIPLRQQSDLALRQRAQAEAELSQCVQEVAQWEADQVILEEQNQQCRVQAERAREARRALVQQIEHMQREAALLEEGLQSQSAQHLLGRTRELTAHLKAIYADLPRDDADSLFTSGRTASTNR